MLPLLGIYVKTTWQAIICKRTFVVGCLRQIRGQTIIKSHHRGTATWFAQGKNFKRWISTNSLLWLHSLRMCLFFVSSTTANDFRCLSRIGKKHLLVCVTTVMFLLGVFMSSRQLNNLRKCPGYGSDWISYPCNFLLYFRDATKQNARNLLSSLLLQISNRTDKFCKVLSSLYSAHGDGSRQPSEDVLMESLKDLLQLPGQGSLNVIIDAFDECPNSSGLTSPRAEVLTIVQELVKLRLPHVHFCITSRPEIDIRGVLEPLENHIVSLHDEIGKNKDIIN